MKISFFAIAKDHQPFAAVKLLELQRRLRLGGGHDFQPSLAGIEIPAVDAMEAAAQMFVQRAWPLRRIDTGEIEDLSERSIGAYRVTAQIPQAGGR